MPLPQYIYVIRTSSGMVRAAFTTRKELVEWVSAFDAPLVTAGWTVLRFATLTPGQYAVISMREFLR